MSTRRRATMGTVRATSNRWKAWYEKGAKTHRPGHTFSTEEAAWSWLRAEQRLIDTGEWTPPAQRRAEAEASEQTFGQYADSWIRGRVTRKGQPLHPRTVTEYNGYLRGILAPIAAKPLVSVTLADVRRWHAANGHRAVMRHRSYSFMRSVFKTATDEQLIAENPCRVENATRKPKTQTDTDKLVRALTHEKVTELAGLVQPRDRLLVLLVAYACIRPGEACALRRADITLGTDQGHRFGWVHIERGISSYDGQRHEGDTKTDEKGERIVPLPPHLIGEVRQHLRKWTEPGKRGLLFPSSNPAQNFRTASQIAGWVEKVSKAGRVVKHGRGWLHARQKANIPTLRLYDLRHWGATLWDEAGTPEALRRAILGHAQPGMTGHYTHPDTTKASPYAVKVSQLAGWTEGTPTNPGTTTVDEALAVLQSATAALQHLEAADIGEVIAKLPPAQAAAVAALMARSAS